MKPRQLFRHILRCGEPQRLENKIERLSKAEDHPGNCYRYDIIEELSFVENKEAWDI